MIRRNPNMLNDSLESELKINLNIESLIHSFWWVYIIVVLKILTPLKFSNETLFNDYGKYTYNLKTTLYTLGTLISYTTFVLLFVFSNTKAPSAGKSIIMVCKYFPIIFIYLLLYLQFIFIGKNV